jgi:hypothetical protein
MVWRQLVFKELQKHEGSIPKSPTNTYPCINLQDQFPTEGSNFDQLAGNERAATPCNIPVSHSQSFKRG